MKYLRERRDAELVSLYLDEKDGCPAVDYHGNLWWTDTQFG